MVCFKTFGREDAMTYIPASSDKVVFCNLIGASGCLPVRHHADDAGADLVSPEEVELKPMEIKLIKVQVAVEIPRRHVGFIKGRSSMNKKGILCHTGTIDSGYRGELGVALQNLSPETVRINQAERIAQLVILPVITPDYVAVPRPLSNSTRDVGGFGSTGA